MTLTRRACASDSKKMTQEHHWVSDIQPKSFNSHNTHQKVIAKLHSFINCHSRRLFTSPGRGIGYSFQLAIICFSPRLCFSLFTLTISQKLPIFILLYLLMILISICQIPVLMLFRQLLTLNYVKLTTG